MKNLFTLILSLIVIAAVAQKRTMDVSDFDEVTLGTAGTMYIKQGSENKVEVNCDDDTFDKLIFEVRGDRFVVKNKEKLGWRNGLRNSDLDVYVTMKDVREVHLSGSGRIEGTNKIKTDEAQISISGSGDIDLDMDAGELSLKISGSGDIELSGNGDYVSGKISGSGKIRAEDMELRSFEATISGSGNCYVNVTESVEARISGSGSVYYDGNPEKVISNASGSGKIRKM